MLSTPQVTPEGQAGFSVVREARGYKGSDENKSFSQEIIFPREEGLKFVDHLQAEANKLHALELEKAKAAGKSFRYAQPVINYRELPDGSIKLNLKRRELDGPPEVLDGKNQPFTGMITRESRIQVAYQLKSYSLPSAFGVSLKLLAIKVVGTGMVSVANLFGGTTEPKEEKVDIKDLF